MQASSKGKHGTQHCVICPYLLSKSHMGSSIGGGTRGALGALGASAPTKFLSAHRNLVFHNRNVSC